MVCAGVLPVVASRPIYRKVRILDNRDLSTGILLGALNLSMPPRIDYMNHATASSHDDLWIEDLSLDFLRHVVLWCVQEFCRSSLLARHTDRFGFSMTGISSRALRAMFGGASS